MSNTQPIKLFNILLLSFSFSTLVENTLFAQASIGVVDYMKVENVDQYVELEKSWKKIHEERLKNKMIVAWAVFEVMYNTAQDPYNYITVSWYDSFTKLDKGVSESTMKAAFPEKTEADWEEFKELTNSSRKLVSSSVFHQRLRTRLEDKIKIQGQYFVINEINVAKAKSKEFVDILEEIYLPMYIEDIKQGNRAVWSLWENWPGNMKDFQYLAADGYDSLAQIEPINFLQYFKDLHPNKNIEVISDRVEEMRELVSTEMWKMIYLVD